MIDPAEIEAYCRACGARPGPGVNNLWPHDPVRAFAMARYLTEVERFDRLVAVAPEGLVYAWFFERFFGRAVLSVHVDYPPTRCASEDDLAVLRGARVLLVEDDVIGGATLRLVVAALRAHAPASVSLYLGHSRFVQRLENVPAEIARTFIAEDVLDPNAYLADERALRRALANP